ncbi:MAG: hypothetical protein ABEI32_09710 [Halothece sp.]|jgi:hypothetical protein
MVGFIKNLFGSKSNNNEEQPKRQKQKAFFLDPDEAKTYGDIDYMRQPNTSKKSFPKTLSNPEGGELVEEVSALEKKSLSKKNGNQTNNNQPSQSSPEPTPENPTASVQNDPAIEQRRKSDSSLDMFRNMARDIKKE